MNKRPRIKLQLKQTDKILEVVGWVSVVGIWAFIHIDMALYYMSFP